MTSTGSAPVFAADGSRVARRDSGYPKVEASGIDPHEATYLLPERQSDLRRIEQLLPTLFVDQSVVELGCGSGHWTGLLASGARHVVATDADPDAMARTAARGLDAAKVSLRLADPYELPETLGGFEGAFAAHWWSRVPVNRRHARLAVLAHRLLPGAKVVFLDHRVGVGAHLPGAAAGLHASRAHPGVGSKPHAFGQAVTAASIRADLQEHGQVLGLLELQHYWVAAWLTPGARR